MPEPPPHSHPADSSPKPSDSRLENQVQEDLRQHKCELQRRNEELQRTYHDLNIATEKLHDLWNYAPVGYVAHDRTGQILVINERAKLLLEQGGQIHKTSTLQRFLNPHSRLVLRQHLWSVMQTREAVTAELMMGTAIGQPEIWVRIETTLSTGGEFRSALIDISALKAAEAERHDLTDQLRQSQKMEVLHELSAGIAHDFNNILQVVIAYGELIRTDLIADGKPIGDISALLHGAVRGADLTKRLLAFTRKSSLEAAAVDLRAVVENAAAVVRRTVEETIQVEAPVGNSPVPVLVDATLIEQAVLNLCLNSRDAMPSGGTLTISTAEVEIQTDSFINGCPVKAGRYAQLSVADNGQGMDHSVVEKIFEPFFTTKRLGSGTGLGLAIVYGVIRQHSGAIKVSSRPGFGTRFDIHLPLLSDGREVKEPEEFPMDSSFGGPGGKILLAEDDESIRRVMTRCLEMAGHTVTAVADGASAIEALKTSQNPYDLLLTDAVMPNGGGSVVCEAFRERLPDCPVIFLTGHGENVIEQGFLESCDVTLLKKPVKSATLLQAVNQAIEKLRQSII